MTWEFFLLSSLAKPGTGFGVIISTGGGGGEGDANVIKKIFKGIKHI
jgi:hypothetical protein